MPIRRRRNPKVLSAATRWLIRELSGQSAWDAYHKRKAAGGFDKPISRKPATKRTSGTTEAQREKEYQRRMKAATKKPHTAAAPAKRKTAARAKPATAQHPRGLTGRTEISAAELRAMLGEEGIRSQVTTPKRGRG